MSVASIFMLLPEDATRSPGSGCQGSLHSWSHGTIIIGVTQKGAHTPVLCPNFYDCCQGIPLHHLALAAYARGSHRTVTKGARAVKQLPPPGHCTDSGLGHIPRLSVKEFACPGASA